MRAFDDGSSGWRRFHGHGSSPASPHGRRFTLSLHTICARRAQATQKPISPRRRRRFSSTHDHHRFRRPPPRPTPPAPLVHAGILTLTAAGDGAPSRSASAIVAGAVCGHHVLKVAGYSRSKDDGPTGTLIDSPPFRAGGRTWFVEYHPNGSSWEARDYISLFLALDYPAAGDVSAQVKISLHDQCGKPVPSYSRTTEVVNFSEQGSWGFSQFIERGILEKSKYLRDDFFTVRFDVTVLKDVRTEETPVVVAPPPSDMHCHFGKFLSSEVGADVKFRVGNQTFSAHRLVLAARSPVFKAELCGQEKETITSQVIPIDGMEAEVFSTLLTFIYTDALPEMKEQEESAMARQLLVAAERYHLVRLKLICEAKLCKHIDANFAATILALAEQHNCHGLKEAVMKSDAFLQLARSHPSVLKQLMSRVVPRWILFRRKSRSRS
ncbi:BTB/POZ and MATH domain-containing protein 2-like [Setaria italica]|uniref:BTB/POZ and MATH domain-containing protein 2-like n=1 Tax=Setaria italica TaxID=4555 RepID=UPI000BE57D3C|nr:BTB/POZ and MATH domain-containing protein 2-like [Setaria italica]